jgi:prevent-host-death family protein
MYKTISAIKARQNLGQVMNEVALRGDEYVIERAGKPLVAMIPMERYAILQKDLDDFFESLNLMRRNIKKEDPEIIDQIIDEAVQFAKKKEMKLKKQQ